jgi:hypothetical protein
LLADGRWHRMSDQKAIPSQRMESAAIQRQQNTIGALTRIKICSAPEATRPLAHDGESGTIPARQQSWKRSKKALPLPASSRFRFCDGLQQILQCRPQPPA